MNNLQIVSQKANFRVRNISAPSHCKITRNKIYRVNEIGFNGHFRVRCDNGRNVWYDNKYFKILDKKLNFKGVIIK